MGEATWLNTGSPQPYVVRVPIGEKPTGDFWHKIETSSDTVTSNYFDTDFEVHDGFGFPDDVELLNPSGSIYRINQTKLITSIDVPKIRYAITSWRQKKNRSVF